ncbi:MAG: AlpA family phage regulatory protein [Proteobacteria bacterium]|nr:AlpA family phage regulatory protein [Pseudomonadota bacterium]
MNTEKTELKIIRKPEVLTLFGLSNASLYRQITAELFPPAFSLGCRATGWYEHEVKQVIAARGAGKTDDDIKALVSELVAARKSLV